MTLPIYQVDAFADTIFRGNPAAVIPLDQWVDASLMQQIAMENNLSETAFFVKEGDGYAIRWFTPEYEIDLCGHATLASSFVIQNFRDPGVKTVEFATQKAGSLRVYHNNGVHTLDFPARMPEPCDVPPILFKSLGIEGAVEVLRSRDYFVVLEDEAAVRSCVPDFSLMEELDTIGVIVTAPGREADVVSRCFYPGAGIPEDPVTGSAHCNIVPYWSRKWNRQELRCAQLSQRGGVLECKLEDDRVLMSGRCVLFLKGELYV
jgi:PhzF family phenazine biosynthesis protein